MAKVLQTFCDPCLGEGVETPADTWTVMVLAPGARKPVPYDLDACEDHAKQFRDLADYLAEVGHRSDQPVTVDRPSPGGVTATKGNRAQEEPAQAEADRTCPECGFVSSTTGGLNSHAKTVHGVTMAELTGEAKLPCPEDGCPRMFLGPQGLAVHLRSGAHP